MSDKHRTITKFTGHRFNMWTTITNVWSGDIKHKRTCYIMTSRTRPTAKQVRRHRKKAINYKKY